MRKEIKKDGIEVYDFTKRNNIERVNLLIIFLSSLLIIFLGIIKNMNNKKIKKQFWVNEDFNNYFIALSKKLGISQSKLFQQKIIDIDILTINNKFSANYEIIRLVKNMTNNLNQIAHYANTYKQLDNKILEEIEKVRLQQKEIKTSNYRRIKKMIITLFPHKGPSKSAVNYCLSDYDHNKNIREVKPKY